MSKKLTVTFGVLPDGPTHTVFGRDAWALLSLIAKGDAGVTPIDTPGPRWSAYVFNLRKLGLEIDTMHEPHTGSFPGTHARYVLRSQVQVLSGPEQQSAVA
jgi:hypothetical protein